VADDLWEGWDESAEPPGRRSVRQGGTSGEDRTTRIARATEDRWIAHLARQRFESELATESAGATVDLNLDDLLDSDEPDVEWLVEPIIAADGGYTGMVSDGKAGKSLLWLEIACALATGRPVLGNPARPPRVVGYLDYENPPSEIRRRIRALGYDVPELRDLLRKNLRYVSMPRFGPLDVEAGAKNLLEWVDRHLPAMLIIDTASRVISIDKEDSSQPWLALFRLTVTPLRVRGVSVGRLDHLGKDRDRGGRGSSAKTQDIDHLWELHSTGSGLLVAERTYSRNGIGLDRFHIRRTGHPTERGTTRHEMQSAAAAEAAGAIAADGVIAALASEADRLGVPPGAAKVPLGEALRKAGHRVGNQRLNELVRYRRARAGVQGDDTRLCPGCQKVRLDGEEKFCEQCYAETGGRGRRREVFGQGALGDEDDGYRPDGL
jgi:hypothetical protein